MRQFWRNHRGQSLAEFALSMPLLLSIFLGVIDLGRGIYYYNSVSSLAREGARFGVVLQSDTDWLVDGNRVGVYNSIQAYAGSSTIVGRIAAQATIFDPSITKVTISAPQGTLRYMSLPLDVAVEYPFQLILPNWLGISSTITLRGESTMRIE